MYEETNASRRGKGGMSGAMGNRRDGDNDPKKP